MSYPEIKALPLNTFLDGLSRLDMNIPYSDRPGCTLDILLPWANQHQHVLGEVKYPLVVFVQGSSWTTPNRGTELPQLSELSRNGYVVATVGHRSCLDGYQAPAFLVDVKTTIRFLRVHAKDYSIDPECVAIWGTSSGGNTALLVGLTAGDKCFFTDECTCESDAVQCVVDCFGPIDLEAMADEDYIEFHDDPTTTFAKLCGFPLNKTMRRQMRLISPMRYVEKGKALPPFLILHGTGDSVVNYNQSERLYHKLLDCGYDATMYKVPDAPHEGSFWSRELVETVHTYLKSRIYMLSN